MVLFQINSMAESFCGGFVWLFYVMVLFVGFMSWFCLIVLCHGFV